jgi:hypothetical protein
MQNMVRQPKRNTSRRSLPDCLTAWRSPITVVVQIAQASENSTFLNSLNDLKELSSKSRAQKYLSGVLP